jgi:hypothetical protein
MDNRPCPIFEESPWEIASAVFGIFMLTFYGMGPMLSIFLVKNERKSASCIKRVNADVVKFVKCDSCKKYRGFHKCYRRCRRKRREGTNTAYMLLRPDHVHEELLEKLRQDDDSIQELVTKEQAAKASIAQFTKQLKELQDSVKQFTKDVKNMKKVQPFKTGAKVRLTVDHEWEPPGDTDPDGKFLKKSHDAQIKKRNKDGTVKISFLWPGTGKDSKRESADGVSTDKLSDVDFEKWENDFREFEFKLDNFRRGNPEFAEWKINPLEFTNKTRLAFTAYGRKILNTMEAVVSE